MFITKKELNRLLQEERLKALEQAERDQWNRSQISDINDEIRNLRREMFEQICSINEKLHMEEAKQNDPVERLCDIR